MHKIQDTYGLGEQSDMQRLNSIKYENGNNETNYFIRVIDDYNMACQTCNVLYDVVWCSAVYVSCQCLNGNRRLCIRIETEACLDLTEI